MVFKSRTFKDQRKGHQACTVIQYAFKSLGLNPLLRYIRSTF